MASIHEFAAKQPTGEVVYRVLLDGRKVRCCTLEDERRFPKQAARLGTELVQRVKRGKWFVA